MVGSAIAPHRKQQRKIAGVQEAAALYDSVIQGRAAEKNSWGARKEAAALYDFVIQGYKFFYSLSF